MFVGFPVQSQTPDSQSHVKQKISGIVSISFCGMLNKINLSAVIDKIPLWPSNTDPESIENNFSSVGFPLVITLKTYGIVFIPLTFPSVYPFGCSQVIGFVKFITDGGSNDPTVITVFPIFFDFSSIIFYVDFPCCAGVLLRPHIKKQLYYLMALKLVQGSDVPATFMKFAGLSPPERKAFRLNKKVNLGDVYQGVTKKIAALPTPLKSNVQLFPAWASKNAQTMKPVTTQQRILAQSIKPQSSMMRQLNKMSTNLAKWDRKQNAWTGQLVNNSYKNHVRTTNKLSQSLTYNGKIISKKLTAEQIEDKIPDMVKQIVEANQIFSSVGIGPKSKYGIPLYAGRYLNPLTGRIDLIPKATSKLMNPTSYHQKIAFLQAKILNKWNQYVAATQSYIKFKQSQDPEDYTAKVNLSILNGLNSGSQWQQISVSRAFYQKVKRIIIRYVTQTLPDNSPYYIIMPRILQQFKNNGLVIADYVADVKNYQQTQFQEIIIPLLDNLGQLIPPIVDEVINNIQSSSLDTMSKARQLKKYVTALESLNYNSGRRLKSSMLKAYKAMSIPQKISVQEVPGLLKQLNQASNIIQAETFNTNIQQVNFQGLQQLVKARQLNPDDPQFKTKGLAFKLLKGNMDNQQKRDDKFVKYPFIQKRDLKYNSKQAWRNGDVPLYYYNAPYNKNTVGKYLQGQQQRNTGIFEKQFETIKAKILEIRQLIKTETSNLSAATEQGQKTLISKKIAQYENQIVKLENQLKVAQYMLKYQVPIQIAMSQLEMKSADLFNDKLNSIALSSQSAIKKPKGRPRPPAPGFKKMKKRERKKRMEQRDDDEEDEDAQ